MEPLALPEQQLTERSSRSASEDQIAAWGMKLPYEARSILTHQLRRRQSAICPLASASKYFEARSGREPSVELISKTDSCRGVDIRRWRL
jgi:hypothetical protein